MKSAYWDEFTHLTFLAIAVTFFVISFKGLGKIVLAKYGPSGLQEVMAQ